MTSKLDKSVLGTLKLVCNTLVHMLIAVVFLFIVYYAVIFYDIYPNVRLHIVFKTLGYQFLMMEAIMTFQGENTWSSLLSRKNKKLVHLFMQVIGSSFILAGFVLAIIFKSVVSVDHFTTDHGKLGLTAFILTMLSVLNGFGTFLMPPGGKRSVGVKMMHNFTGMSAIVIGLVCLIMGMNEINFIERTGDTLYIVATVFVAICICYIIIRPLMNIITHINSLLRS